MKRHISPFLNIFEIKFKVLAFFALFLYVIGLFTYALKEFRSEDPVPPVEAITLDMRKQFRDLSATVRTGLFIKNFPTFEFTLY